MRLSPFFIRASAGPVSKPVIRSQRGVSVPSSSGHRPDSIVTKSAIFRSSQSLLHQGIGRTMLPACLITFVRSQSLLHQGIGRTSHNCSAEEAESLSPFFIRASAGRVFPLPMEIRIGLSPFFIRASAGLKGYDKEVTGPGLSPFFIRASAGRLPSPRRLSETVSVPSSSGHRPDPQSLWLLAVDGSQSLLHQGIGRTFLYRSGGSRASQSLLHQGIGRT